MEPTPQTDTKVVKAVVYGLILISLALIAGSFALLLADKAVPETIWTLTATVLGALAAMLVSTHSTAAPVPAEPVIPAVPLGAARAIESVVGVGGDVLDASGHYDAVPPAPPV